MKDLWTYPDQYQGTVLDIDGFDVVATDGEIGKIDEATYDVSSSYVVVDTGPWIFGRKVLLPAGVIQHIDQDDQKVSVRLTKEQIKNSPELDKDTMDYMSDVYRDKVGSYYGSF